MTSIAPASSASASAARPISKQQELEESYALRLVSVATSSEAALSAPSRQMEETYAGICCSVESYKLFEKREVAAIAAIQERIAVNSAFIRAAHKRIQSLNEDEWCS